MKSQMFTDSDRYSATLSPALCSLLSLQHMEGLRPATCTLWRMYFTRHKLHALTHASNPVPPGEAFLLGCGSRVNKIAVLETNLAA